MKDSTLTLSSRRWQMMRLRYHYLPAFKLKSPNTIPPLGLIDISLPSPHLIPVAYSYIIRLPQPPREIVTSTTYDSTEAGNLPPELHLSQLYILLCP